MTDRKQPPRYADPYTWMIAWYEERLEQAERERDRWADRFDRQYTLAEAHEARLKKADKLAEALQIICDIGETRDVVVASAALAEWEYRAAVRDDAAESIRSTGDETPANEGDEAPSGFEPLFQSAEPKADR